MSVVVNADAVAALIDALRGDGRTIIAPAERDGAIRPDVIESVDELPIGWADANEAGVVGMVETDTGEWFASASGSDSWKRFLTPPETLMVRSRRSGDALTIEQPRPDAPSMAFFGIRSCDIAAIGALDRVMLAPGRTDPDYAARRTDLFIVAAACAHPGATCFCASMGTGPTPTAGFDISLTEFWGDERHEFLATAGSERGDAKLAALGGRPATDADFAAARAQHDASTQAMGRALDHGNVGRVTAEHTHWLDVGDRCLACGNCTMVCPTCFCNKTADRSDLTGETAERWRVWDSCFSADFSSLHGQPVRATIADRYRQWLMHKLVTWHDQFDMSGCVGCGRCISACPVGIDLTTEIPELASS